MVWVDLGAGCQVLTKTLYNFVLAKIEREENKMEKSPLCQDKGNLIKQRLHMEAKV